MNSSNNDDRVEQLQTNKFREFTESNLEDIKEQYDSLPSLNGVKDCSCESTVLIVDDNMFNLIPLELILKEMFNIQVDKALNGLEAANMFEKNLQKTCCDVHYKLVLMDLNMPIMDGYESTI